MTLRNLSVRAFRKEMSHLDEAVTVGDGYYFPNWALLEEYLRDVIVRDAIGSPGEPRDKTPRPGESVLKAPSEGDEATQAAASSEGAREGSSEREGERESVRSQAHASSPTHTTRAMQQATRDAILRRVNRAR